MTARDIAAVLPGIDFLKDLCRSMAMAEAILNPDGECFYSYSAEWSETEQVASMRNGSGDEFDIVFAPVGAYIRGFDHESPLSPYWREDVPQPWPGVLDSVPEAFRRYVDEARNPGAIFVVAADQSGARQVTRPPEDFVEDSRTGRRTAS